MGAIVAGLIGWNAPGAAAGPAATEEYVLTLPGVDTNRVGPPAPIVERARRAGPVGVVGESEPAESTLAALGSAATTPGGVAVVIALAGGVGLATVRGRRSIR